LLCAGRLCSPGSLGSGAVGARVLCGRVPAVQLSVAGRCCSTAAAVVGVCLDCISIAILLSCCFLARGFVVAWLAPLAGACWPGFGEVLRAWVQVGPWPSGPPHAYLVAGRPPRWPELVSYVGRLGFRSSSLPPLDRTSTTFSLHRDFGSTCCALRDST